MNDLLNSLALQRKRSSHKTSICIYYMGRHRQDSSVNCLADLLLPALVGTAWCPASSGVTMGVLDVGLPCPDVAHCNPVQKRGCVRRSASQGQKCLIPSVPATGWQESLQLPSHHCLMCSQDVCCAELSAGTSSMQDILCAQQGILHSQDPNTLSLHSPQYSH